MEMQFRICNKRAAAAEISIELMLYICKTCDHSFSLPLPPDARQQDFLFPAGNNHYVYLEFSGKEELLDTICNKIEKYSYPYLNFERFERVEFLEYVKERLWADLIDRPEGERIGCSVKDTCCPHCGSRKLKVIGRLLPTQEESDFQISAASLDGFLSLSSEEQNRVIILLLKNYAADFRENAEPRKKQKAKDN